jgi:hypothetical protein
MAIIFIRMMVVNTWMEGSHTMLHGKSDGQHPSSFLLNTITCQVDQSTINLFAYSQKILKVYRVEIGILMVHCFPNGDSPAIERCDESWRQQMKKAHYSRMDSWE